MCVSVVVVFVIPVSGERGSGGRAEIPGCRVTLREDDFFGRTRDVIARVALVVIGGATARACSILV